MSLESLDRAVNKTVDLSVGDIVAKYGSKDAILMALQKGEIADPTKAIMAGMAIDRIAASAIQPPQGTVATDVFPPNQPQMGIAAAQQMPQQAPQMRGGQGLDQVPVPEAMFDEQRMAGGGIVAFQRGGQSSLQDILNQMSMQELQYYQRTGRLPEKYRMMMPGAEPTLTGALEERGVPTSSVGAPMAPTPSTTPRLTFGEAAPFVGVGPEQVDPFSGTQTYSGDMTQADVGFIPPPGTPEAAPSDAMLKQAAEDETKKAEERKAVIPPPPPETKKETQASGFDSILQEINAQMPQDKAYETLEGEILKDRESRGKEKEQAGWMRLAEAGLGIMGGESPYAMVNIGKGAAAALKGYGEDLKEQKKLNREDRKILADIEQARRAEKAGNIKLAAESYDKALDRTSAEKRTMLQVEAQLRAVVAQVKKPSDAIRLVREMMVDPEFKKAVIELEQAKAAAKDPLADLLRQAREGGGGANLGAQLGELMKKYPQAFQ
jgi:hypothetical protein